VPNSSAKFLQQEKIVGQLKTHEITIEQQISSDILPNFQMEIEMAASLFESNFAYSHKAETTGDIGAKKSSHREWKAFFERATRMKLRGKTIINGADCLS
jgi:hypothetical protein